MAIYKAIQPNSVRACDLSNQALRSDLEGLEASQRTGMIKAMSPSQRKVCVQIIEENKFHWVTLKDKEKLIQRIERAKVSPCAVRQVVKSPPLSARRVVRIIVDNILKFLGVLTARKANIIITKLFAMKEAAKSYVIEGDSFTNSIFENKTFEKLENVTFKNCVIRGSFFTGGELKGCRFENCQIEETLFIEAELEGVAFVNGRIAKSSFEGASFKECTFEKVTMPATHFLEASVEESAISDSNLEDTVFFDAFKDFHVDDNSARTAVLTRPVTSMLVSSCDVGFSLPKVSAKIDKKTEVVLLRIAINRSSDSLLMQTQEMLKVQKAIIGKTGYSLAKLMLEEIESNKKAYPVSFRILTKAKKVAEHSSSFFLPGGEDIPPEFYAGLHDYRRSILELGFIASAFHMGIPLMGVCRGFQMANVYFGAGLVPHVEVQNLELTKEEKRGLYAKVMKDTLVGVSFHHQAVDAANSAKEHLEVSSAYDNLVKASEPKTGAAAPMILLQFHPEFYDTPDEEGCSFFLSKNNDLFWALLSDSATAYNNKRAVLADIRKKSA